MNPQMIQAASELSEQTGIPFSVMFRLVRGVWTQLTGQPVMTDPSLELFALDE